MIQTKNKKNTNGQEWNLSDLYSGLNDVTIEKDKKQIRDLVLAFTTKYKSRINSSDLTADLLFGSFKDLEVLLDKLYRLYSFSMNSFNKNTKDQRMAKFNQGVKEFLSEISADLAWYDLELSFASDEKIAELLNDVKISQNYTEYVESVRVLKPYKLSEAEEKLVAKLGQSGPSAFRRLYNENSSSLRYELKLKNKKQQLDYGQLVSQMNTNPARSVRKEASEALTKTLKENSKLNTFILNTLLLDKKVSDEIRGLKYPQQATMLTYRVDKEVVDALASSTEKNYSVSEQFYQHKKTLMDEKELFEWDRYCSVFDTKEQKVTWNEAKEIVLDAFSQFSPVFYETAKMMFDNNWIDSVVVDGKTPGAYCSSATPTHHPLVLMSFNNKMNDVMTLAHELGHAVHAYLSKKQPLLAYDSSIAVAEIASVFAEMVTFDYVLKNTTDKKLKLNLLLEDIQGSFATIFRQIAFYLFESDLHIHRRDKGELSTDEINNYFQTRLQAMFGKGLTLTENHKFWWAPVGHFYKYNFYVFTYAFGQALTLALYARYLEDKKSFVSKYTEVLSLGGSKKPSDLVSLLGIDISDASFWDRGVSYLAKNVEDFIKLSS